MALRKDMGQRIAFLPDLQIMDVNFSGFDFDTSETVNRVYDEIENRIEASGQPLWFFLINYSRSRIDPSAWVTYSRRGKALNLAHSQGTVRYDASEETRRQIKRSADTDAFDANLFADRHGALARLKSMPSKRKERRLLTSQHSAEEIAARISFDEAQTVMEADFSDFTFHNSRDVDDVYDHIEDRIKATDKKWFFLVNYNNCQIMPEAWVRYAHRGKRLNIAASLGSVRFAAGSETEADIRMRSQSQNFRPNIHNTREQALAQIAEMREELIAQLSNLS